VGNSWKGKGKEDNTTHRKDREMRTRKERTKSEGNGGEEEGTNLDREFEGVVS
jgi:hypothetical protein